MPRVSPMATSAFARETSMHTLNELFEETLKDVYFAEKTILKALPKMTKQASSELP